MDKSKARKKVMKTKKRHDTIELSDNKPQEAKRKEGTILAEDTSPIPKADEIEKFRMSMVYGAQVVTPILQILEESRTLVEEEVGWRMTLTGIVLHLSKENKIEEMQRLRMEAHKANQEKLQAQDTIKNMKLVCDIFQLESKMKDELL
ncbi:hypothetical protein R1flu_027281 [Riccia fluitans]|uniref:Uncharacterized protein n=1 Tax=Riccia fluitans TaxID=41844 RepID=A0ABD1XIB6_9MARC